MPSVFKNIEVVKEIFRSEKRRLQKKNWFELIDKAIIEHKSESDGPKK